VFVFIIWDKATTMMIRAGVDKVGVIVDGGGIPLQTNQRVNGKYY